MEEEKEQAHASEPSRPRSLQVSCRRGKAMSERLGAARARAAEGWAVHALFGIVSGRCECKKGAQCDTPGKHPRLRGWSEHATHDPAQIQQWWQRWPQSNIGGAAGKKSGRDVLDVDPRHGGDVSLDVLEA